MARCIRCWLLTYINILNLLQTLFGVVMIVYSLWLLKKWHIGISSFPTSSHFPKPWFVYTCLGVGIALCLSNLFGHIAANHNNHSISCTVNVIVLTIILWIVGTTEPRRHSAYLVIPDFNRSFLLEPYSPMLENRGQDCRNCEVLRVENQGFLTHIRNAIRIRLEERTRHSNGH